MGLRFNKLNHHEPGYLEIQKRQQLKKPAIQGIVWVPAGPVFLFAVGREGHRVVSLMLSMVLSFISKCLNPFFLSRPLRSRTQRRGGVDF
jgi:hypothetical protein